MNNLDQNSFIQKSVIHVGGLHPYATAAQLQALFITFGPINNVAVPLDLKDKQTNDKTTDKGNNHTNDPQPESNEPPRNRGFALIDFEDPEDAQHAVTNMNDSEFFGMILRVSIAQPNAAKGKAKWDIVNDNDGVMGDNGSAD